jgi:hypothetical protein
MAPKFEFMGETLDMIRQSIRGPITIDRQPYFSDLLSGTYDNAAEVVSILNSISDASTNNARQTTDTYRSTTVRLAQLQKNLERDTAVMIAEELRIRGNNPAPPTPPQNTDLWSDIRAFFTGLAKSARLAFW